MNKKEIMFEMLRKLAILKGVEVSPERLKLYCEGLHGFDVESLRMACERLGATCKYFPDISEFFALLKPKLSYIDEANRISGEIFKAVRRFGYNNSSEAKKYLGDDVWDIIDQIGGWYSICNCDVSKQSTLRAQIRDLSKAVIAQKPMQSVLTNKNDSEKQITH